MNLTAIREAFAAQIKNNVSAEINVYPYRRSSLNPPYVVIDGSTDNYLQFHATWARNGVHEIEFVLEIRATGAGENSGPLIDSLLSYGTDQPSSIIEALRADRTLGGVVANTVVSTGQGPVIDDTGATAFLAVTIQPLPEAS